MTALKRKSPRVSKRGVAKLEDLMNVGPSIADDLRGIGIMHPDDLIGKDPYALYEKLCRQTGVLSGSLPTDTTVRTAAGAL